MDEHLEELFPFYALSALSDEERAQVDAYVAANPAARARLDEAIRAATAVPLSVAPVEPSLAVKRDLMIRVNADAERRATPVAQRSRPVHVRWYDRSFFRFALPVVATAALIAAIILGMWSVSLKAEVQSLRQQTALLQQQLLTQREVLAQISNPKVQAMSLDGTTLQPGAHGQVLADPRGKTAVLIVSDLKPLPQGEVYQFWFMHGSAGVSGGVLSVDEQGRAVLPVSISETVNAFDSMGISIEPSGGSQQPTGDIVMFTKLS